MGWAAKRQRCRCVWGVGVCWQSSSEVEWANMPWQGQAIDLLEEVLCGCMVGQKTKQTGLIKQDRAEENIFVGGSCYIPNSSNIIFDGMCIFICLWISCCRGDSFGVDRRPGEWPRSAHWFVFILYTGTSIHHHWLWLSVCVSCRLGVGGAAVFYDTQNTFFASSADCILLISPSRNSVITGKYWECSTTQTHTMTETENMFV